METCKKISGELEKKEGEEEVEEEEGEEGESKGIYRLCYPAQKGKVLPRIFFFSESFMKE